MGLLKKFWKQIISVLITLVIDFGSRDFSGVGFEGRIINQGFPIRHTTSYAGFPHTNYTFLFIDLVILFFCSYLALHMLERLLTRPSGLQK